MKLYFTQVFPILFPFIFTLNGCATVAGTNALAQYGVNKVIPNVFKKKPHYWVDNWNVEPWSQLVVDCFNKPFKDKSASKVLAWERYCINARKNIQSMVEKEAYRLGYGKRGKTHLSNEEQFTLVENVKKKLTYEKEFLR